MPLSKSLLDNLRTIVDTENVLTVKEDLIPYAIDGAATMQEAPDCVVFTVSTELISQVLNLANIRVDHPITRLAETYRKENT